MGGGVGRRGAEGRIGKTTDTKQEYSMSDSEYVFYMRKKYIKQGQGKRVSELRGKVS